MSLWTAAGIVSFAETDASGRYHYTAAYRWAEDAEHAFYRSVIPGIDLGRFPRRATSATYERPLAAGDEYTVELDADRVGTSSVTYAWVISGSAGVCAHGSHTVVYVDETGRPAPFPAELRERLASSVREPMRSGIPENVPQRRKPQPGDGPRGPAEQPCRS